MFLVRHPETTGTLHGVDTSADIGPDAKGKVQAIKVASFFKGKPVKKIYTSPTKRTRYQADAIAKVSGASVQEDDRLKPWSLKSSSENDYNQKLDHYTQNPDEKPPENDETFNDFASRVQDFHSEHADEPQTVAVTHSKNIMTHKAVALHDESAVGSAARNKIKDTKVSTVTSSKFKPELVLKNDTTEERRDS